jgi:hypothetical protein
MGASPYCTSLGAGAAGVLAFFGECAGVIVVCREFYHEVCEKTFQLSGMYVINHHYHHFLSVLSVSLDEVVKNVELQEKNINVELDRRLRSSVSQLSGEYSKGCENTCDRETCGRENNKIKHHFTSCPIASK